MNKVVHIGIILSDVVVKNATVDHDGVFMGMTKKNIVIHCHDIIRYTRHVTVS